MAKKPSLTVAAGLSVLALLLPGCSSISLPSLPWSWSTSDPQANASAETLFNEGLNYFNNKKYALAIDRFQRVKADFPFSPQIIPAELKLAEAYYGNKQYPEAAAAFKEFKDLHPNNENIPFVVYHLGLVHFEQFTTSDRTQKETEIAKGYFESVIKDYPGSPYAAPAKEKLAKCLEYLSEYEFNVATFYFNDRKYPAAIDRLDGILRNYRGTPVAVKALYYLGESYRLEKNEVKAALAYQALIEHYPEDPMAKSAQARLNEVAKEKQDPLALLLQRDGRPPAVLPPLPGQATANGAQEPAEKTVNLVAKKEVVHEEPGDDNKGTFRRVLDTLNPFASSSDNKNDHKEDGSKTAASAAQDGAPKQASNGFFSSLWPWGKNGSSAGTDQAKIDPGQNSQLVNKIDSSLKQQGIDSGAQDVTAPPPSNLAKKVEQPPAPVTDTKELLGTVDSQLKTEGKDTAALPPVPEPSPAFRASAENGAKPSAAAAGQTSNDQLSPSTSGGLMAGIDAKLKQKGIDTDKISSPADGSDAGSQGSRTATVTNRQKVELSTKLPTQKGPLFLGDDAGQGQKAGQGQPSDQTATQPADSSAPTGELPKAAVQGPPQPVKEKAPDTKVAQKKNSPDEGDEKKGAFDQLKEDIGRLQNLLNPFGW